MSSDARLLIIEMVLPEGDTPHPGKIIDMAMLVATGGQERTESEYAALLAKAGSTPNTGCPHRIGRQHRRGRSRLKLVISSPSALDALYLHPTCRNSPR